MSMTYHKYPTYDDTVIRVVKALLLATGFIVKYRNRDGKQYLSLIDHGGRPYSLIRSVAVSIMYEAGIPNVLMTSYGGTAVWRINPEEPGFVWTDDNVKLPAPRPAISSFKGKYKFLSNFHNTAVFGYPSVEHAYHASKCANKTDQEQFKTGTAGNAKRLGRKVQLRADWSDALKIKIMRDLVREKFMQHPKLAKRLLATGDDELIEGNWWKDVFWGVCDGVGKNHLGKILMGIREELSHYENYD